MSKRKILVVEDFDSIGNFLCHSLGINGYEPIRAANGEEALHMLQSAPVDLILSDYNMPKLNGMELLKKVKANPSTRHLPVIFLTTEDDLEKKRIAKAAGLSAWIKKPFRHDTFFGYVENALANG